MPTTRSSKRYTIIPNGLSEEEVDSSESEDESTINEQSSSSEENDVEEIVQKGPP
jgi:hypothetical protein